jgi:acyl carrier protein
MNDKSYQKLQSLFARALGIEEDLVNEGLCYRSIPEWDSIGHMALVAAIESEYNVMLDTNDILDLSSLKVAKEILVRHGIQLPDLQ